LNGVSEEYMIRLAASAEDGSEHPLSQAIVEYAKNHNGQLSAAEEFEAVTGKGIRASVDGQEILVGTRKLLAESGIKIDETIENQMSRLEEQAKTAMLVAVAGEAAGIIAVADPIKEDSKKAIAALKEFGMMPIMITGDNERTARAVADEVGIDRVMAEVPPDQKVDQVSALQAEGRTVAMVGDGINDAPALAQADVGIAIGTGTDVAIEAADVTLIGGSLASVAVAIDTSQATFRNIEQNLAGAFGYNTLGIPVAAGVLYPTSGLLLSPLIAGAAMAFSSVTVVTNANRLRFYEPKEG
jgi:Cu+-exporting ATPase